MNPENITVKIGEWHDAIEFLEKRGGMLFPGKDKDSPISVVTGNKTTTFWTPHSKKRGDLMMYCHQLGLPPELAEKMTSGRLARYYLSDILNLPYKETFWGKKYRKLAKEAWHWHYLYCKPGNYTFAVEVDFQSAYLSAFLTGETMLLADSGDWLPDNGALERLKHDALSMPKWFRLSLLGTLASHNLGFLCRDKDKEDFSLKYCELSKISYGAAFNAAHRAILRNWRIMEESHKICGDSAIRLHTDCVVVDMGTLSNTAENRLFEYLGEVGVRTTVKKAGRTSIKDVNTGWIGRDIFGGKEDVTNWIKEIKSLPPEGKPSKADLGTIGQRVDAIKKGLIDSANKPDFSINPADVCERLGVIFRKSPDYFRDFYGENILKRLPPVPPKTAKEKWARTELIAVDIAAEIIEEGGIKEKYEQLPILG